MKNVVRVGLWFVFVCLLGTMSLGASAQTSQTNKVSADKIKIPSGAPSNGSSQPSFAPSGSPESPAALGALQSSEPTEKQPSVAPDPLLNPVLADFIKSGVKVYYLGLRDGLNGWFLTKDNQIQIAYVPLDNRHIVFGALFDSLGNNVSTDQMKALYESNREVYTYLENYNNQQNQTSKGGVGGFGQPYMPGLPQGAGAGAGFPGMAGASMPGMPGGIPGMPPSASMPSMPNGGSMPGMGGGPNTSSLPGMASVAGALPDAASLTDTPPLLPSSSSMTSPGERLISALKSADGVDLGVSGSPMIYMVADPNCPHCQATWKMLRDSIMGGKLEVRIVPIDALGTPDSERAAAQLLRVKDPLLAWDKYVTDGDKSQLAGTADINALNAVRKNLGLIISWHIQVTPYLVYRSKTGQVKIETGEPKDLAQLLADVGP